MIGQQVTTVSSARLMPVRDAEQGPILPGVQGGVLDQSGHNVPQGELMRHYAPVRHFPDGRPAITEYRSKTPFRFNGDALQEAVTQKLNGQVIFAGYLFDHFGHFLTESLAKLWFIKNHPNVPIAWLPIRGKGKLSSWQRELLDILGVENPVHVTNQPTEVETLLVPDDGFMIQTQFTRLQQQALGVRKGQAVKPGKKVWLSRSGLDAGRYLNDTQLEKLLVNAGWAIFHPERHTIAQQLDMLADAERIASVEGSALHILMLFTELRARVDIFVRGRILSQNYQVIADLCGFEQHVHYIPGVLFSDDLPGWQSNYVWLNLDPVLDCLSVQLPATNAGVSQLADDVYRTTQGSGRMLWVDDGPLASLPPKRLAEGLVYLSSARMHQSPVANGYQFFDMNLDQFLLSQTAGDDLYDRVIINQVQDVKHLSRTLAMLSGSLAVGCQLWIKLVSTSEGAAVASLLNTLWPFALMSGRTLDGAAYLVMTDGRSYPK